MSSPEPPMITAPSAPDIEEVRAWLGKMLKELRFAELIAAILALITRLRDLNLDLVKQITHMRRARPRSETWRRLVGQQPLPLDLDGARKRGDAKPKKPKKSRKGVHPGRAALPAHLRREPELNPVPPERRICPLCGRTMETVGYDPCEILEVRPAQLYVRVRMDERVACPHDDTIVSALTPPQIVERGKLGDTLIVEGVCDKYLEHQPTERQCRRFTRAGVDLPPQTLGRSMAACIDLVEPIARLIQDKTRASTMLATDSSGLPVLDDDHPQGIRNGTMWCWVGDHKWVTFFYSAIGDSGSVKAFLGKTPKDFARTVQCDGTSLTAFLERAGGKRPGCWSHGRRRFVACARGGDALALVPLRKIRRLFAVERLSALLGETADERLCRRREHSAPVVAELRAWVDEQRKVIPPKSAMGKALGYLHRQWHRLVLFLTDGNIELTNNRVERELRSLVLGRKNWLFAYGDLGGKRAAVILTILGTCIAQRVNPRAYMHLVTKLIVHGHPHARLHELLPDKLAALNPDLRLPARAVRAPPPPSLPP